MYRLTNFALKTSTACTRLCVPDFCITVSNGSTGLCASHMPTVLKDEGAYGVIECHLARANTHWKDVASGNEALMIFQGPEGYITPNWYPSKAQHGKVVPTWNYAIVHAYGRPEVMENKEWLRRHVGELTTQQERTQSRPWAVSDAPESFVDAMLRGIVGFCFIITRLEGKWKMNQNRELNDQPWRCQRPRPASRRRRSRNC